MSFSRPTADGRYKISTLMAGRPGQFEVVLFHGPYFGGGPSFDFDVVNARAFARDLLIAANVAERHAIQGDAFDGKDDDTCAKCGTHLVTVSAGANDVATERLRQVRSEKWTPEHDDEHDDGELAVVAAELVLAHTTATFYDPDCDDVSYRRDPWGLLKKHRDTRRRLVIAGALIAAEIDRLDRAAAKALAKKDGTKP